MAIGAIANCPGMLLDRQLFNKKQISTLQYSDKSFVDSFLQFFTNWQ